ncbi:hypothetical protein [Flammeovirga aprica]
MYIFLSFTGIIGSLLFILLFSKDPMLNENYNLLWLNPLNIIVCVICNYKKVTNYFIMHNSCHFILIVYAIISNHINYSYLFFTISVISINWLILYDQIYKNKSTISKQIK